MPGRARRPLMLRRWLMQLPVRARTAPRATRPRPARRCVRRRPPPPQLWPRLPPRVSLRRSGLWGREQRRQPKRRLPRHPGRCGRTSRVSPWPSGWIGCANCAKPAALPIPIGWSRKSVAGFPTRRCRTICADGLLWIPNRFHPPRPNPGSVAKAAANPASSIVIGKRSLTMKSRCGLGKSARNCRRQTPRIYYNYLCLNDL